VAAERCPSKWRGEITVRKEVASDAKESVETNILLVVTALFQRHKDLI